MDSERGAVYCTLLLSDYYLPGAMVLAHSLRDNGTRARLVALYTPDTLQPVTVNELRTVYDELIPVHPIVNGTPANLWLMDRPDLIATFTKIDLWRLTQFEKIVYIDCDVVAVRAPDELLSLEVDFAAAPDVGWPDCFNSGLMVLRPSMQDYFALKALAERGISFDGADQGLLNMHFHDWHRLSFTYNCTPSANYQYIPAYKHFQSTISLIHFIGAQKPWNLPRQVVPLESPYNQLLARWWAVYDKHYRPPFVSISQPVNEPSGIHSATHAGEIVPPASSLAPISSHTEGQSQPQRVEEGDPVSFHHEDVQSEYVPALISATHEQTESSGQQHHHDHHVEFQHPPSEQHTEPAAAVPILSAVPQYVRGEEHVSTYIPPLPHIPASVFSVSHQSSDRQPEALVEHHEHHQPGHDQPTTSEPHIYQPQPVGPTSHVAQLHHRPPSPEPEPPTFEAPRAEWDAAREPPPLNSRPEGLSLQEKTYTMSEDTNLFQPPPSYPEAPKNMYYQVPAKKPEPKQLAQIFPWESRAPKPTRVFADEPTVSAVPHQEEVAPPETSAPSFPTQVSPPQAPKESLTESWESYSRSNAWDEDPYIQRYIESMTQARRAKTQVISGTSQPNADQATKATSPTGPAPGRRPSIKLTDFPTEVERPSLPVTPAPIVRKPSGGDGQAEGQDPSVATALPAAEGVPSQEDWVGVTAEAFSHLLRATYLLWRSTESSGPTRRAPSATVVRRGDPEQLLSRLSEHAEPKYELDPSGEAPVAASYEEK